MSSAGTDVKERVAEAGRCPGTEVSRLSRPPVRRRIIGQGTPLDRLQEAIEAAAAMQRARHKSPSSCSTPGQSIYCHLIDELLTYAKKAYDEGDANRGWGYVHRARETEVLLMGRGELDAVAVALAAECLGGKVPGWRREAIKGLLQRMSKPPYPVAPEASLASHCEAVQEVQVRSGPLEEPDIHRDARLVKEALTVRNQYFGNTYTALEITARRRLWLMAIGVVLVLGLLLLQWRAGPLPSDSLGSKEGDNLLTETWLPPVMACLGALGAVISAIQRLAADPLNGTIPAQLGSFTATVTRPLIGAVAALTVFLAARGGLIVPDQNPVPLLLLAAFTAGLTERLVVFRERGDSTSAPDVPPGRST